MANLITKLAHAWNAFQNQDDRLRIASYDGGASYATRPDRSRLRGSNEKSIVSSILTRLSIDCSSIDMRHIRMDKEGNYVENIDSGLNDCLTVEANIDQGARAFRQDIFLTLFDKGCCALVPVDTTINPQVSTSFDIKTMRVGEIVSWMPQHVRVSVYNEATGYREDLTLEKRFVAIIENPLYSVMNEPNSTLQRLIRKLNLLDVVDEQAGSGKLDLIIQLPYVVKSAARRQAAEQRRTDLEVQLKNSKYGVAYTDGTEKITQLNRPAENNLLGTVEYLTDMLYSQLGLTKAIMDGTADEQTMLNYKSRTIEPLLTAVVEAMRRAFLTKTGRSQGQTIAFFSDPFKLVPLSQIAEIADKFNRNEVLTGNEMRGIIGFRPSKDPKADELRNSNMPEPKPPPPEPSPTIPVETGGDGQNGSS